MAVEKKPSPEEWRPEGSHVVVCVDDELPVLASIGRALRREPYELITTDKPREALEVVEKRDVSVLVADERMPGMRGTELLSAVRRRSPRTRSVMLTGYADMDAISQALKEGGIRRLIGKPWNDDDLRRTIRDLIRERESAPAAAEYDQSVHGLEELLKRQTWSLRFSQEMLDGLETPIAGVSSRDLRFLTWNRAFLRLFDPPPASLRDVEAREALPAEVCARMLRMMEAHEEQGFLHVPLGGGWTRFQLRTLRSGEAMLGVMVSVSGDIPSGGLGLRRPSAAEIAGGPSEVRIDCLEMTAPELLEEMARVLRRRQGRAGRLDVVIQNLPGLADSISRFLKDLLRTLAEAETAASIVERSGFLRVLLGAVGAAFPLVSLAGAEEAE